jgi:hypothetical protein
MSIRIAAAALLFLTCWAIAAEAKAPWFKLLLPSQGSSAPFVVVSGARFNAVGNNILVLKGIGSI